jgi:hypothetical protein
VWKTQKQPGFDLKIQRGTIYSIRYRYEAHWYVKQLVHEIRVAQVTDPATFERHLERLPYAVQIQREFIFLESQRTESGKGPGESRSPGSGGTLGPR